MVVFLSRKINSNNKHYLKDGVLQMNKIVIFKDLEWSIIDSNDKEFYMRGLKEYKRDKMFLIDTIKHEQDIYENICKELLNFALK